MSKIDTPTLTDHQAFLAMYSYLEQFYERTQSDDVATILGGLSLLPDGTFADPASSQEWADACAAARQGKVNARLTLR
jgi:hypothetical protein